MTFDGWNLTTLVTFNGTNGSYPEAPLIQGNDGNFYGTTCAGGTNGDGTVFGIKTNGVFTCLASFAVTNGAQAIAGLVQGTDGNFYGTTISGGNSPRQSYGYGTVFKMTSDGTLTRLYSFPGSGFTGIYPDAGLVEGPDGDFYGTTEGGMSGYTYGAIFKINTNGVLNKLFNFDLENESTDGSTPRGPLVLGPDGNFYGMTYAGGANGLGTVFRISTNGTLNCLVTFNGTNGANDDNEIYNLSGPFLVLATDGNFYGTTPSGGASGLGTIFMMTPNGTLTTVYSFIDNNGANPTGLIQASDGNFYGTTTLTSESEYGGGIGNGTIFRISIPLQPKFQSVAQANGTITHKWSAVASRTYQLQYTTDLTSTNWTDLGGIITATNGIMSTTDVINSDTQRFYRVVLLQ